MTALHHQLIALLADGEPHTGDALAQRLGVGHQAVRQGLRMLDRLGFSVDAGAAGQVRLMHPVDLLREDVVIAAMGERAVDRLTRLDLLPEVDSTSDHLLRLAQDGMSTCAACVAERQTAGRGRRGRRWVSPFAAGLYLSLLWPEADRDPLRPARSLAVGVAVARALAELGVTGIGLKWPNDVLWDHRKLGGILVEAVPRPMSATVIGIGVNGRMPGTAGRAVEQQWVDLDAACCGRGPTRSRLAGRVIDHVVQAMEQFDHEGLAAFRREWTALDVLQGQAVTVTGSDGPVHGVVQGVADDGALYLEVGDELRRYHTGHVTVRQQECESR